MQNIFGETQAELAVAATAFAEFAGNGNIRIWCSDVTSFERHSRNHRNMEPLFLEPEEPGDMAVAYTVLCDDGERHLRSTHPGQLEALQERSQKPAQALYRRTQTIQ